MTATMVRFPRRAYARRAAELAEDLELWVPGLLEYAHGNESWILSPQKVARAEERAAVIQDLVETLQVVTMRLAAIR